MNIDISSFCFVTAVPVLLMRQYLTFIVPSYITVLLHAWFAIAVKGSALSLPCCPGHCFTQLHSAVLFHNHTCYASL